MSLYKYDNRICKTSIMMRKNNNDDYIILIVFLIQSNMDLMNIYLL
jgi:hypothetical protein